MKKISIIILISVFVNPVFAKKKVTGHPLDEMQGANDERAEAYKKSVGVKRRGKQRSRSPRGDQLQKKIYKYRKSQNHSFGPSEVLGKSYNPSEILNEEHPQSFKYIFDSKVKVIRKINKMSKYLGRSL